MYTLPIWWLYAQVMPPVLRFRLMPASLPLWIHAGQLGFAGCPARLGRVPGRGGPTGPAGMEGA